MHKLLVVSLLWLASCTTPETPAQSVFLAQSHYATALKIELAYSALPRCPAAKVCSDVAVIKKVQKADNVAWSALKEAQVAVRTPGFGDGRVVTAVASARALTNAFVEITQTLEIE